MNKGKKSFFYHPTYRANIYMFAWAFIWCFKLVGLLNQKCHGILEKAESGQSSAAAIIGFTSGLIFEFVLILFMYDKINWSIENITIFFFIYILLGLMGWISIIKLRDYELEEQ